MGHTVTGIPTDEHEPQTYDVLPPEIWASVIEYLPFETILACSATCRTMLHAMPLLKKICIGESYQMNLAVASRFRDITEIHINSLLEATVQNEGMGEDEFTTIDVDLETKIRVVLFLSRFDKLKMVHFGVKTENGEIMEGFAPANGHFWEEGEGYPNEADRDRMMALLDNISEAFSFGALPTDLKISGLCCPNGRNSSCETCLRACKNFPLKSVVEFESNGSSSSSAKLGRMYGLDVCLERAQIESIIESRPGGKQLLCSEDRLLRLLGRGRRYKIVSNVGGGEGNPLYIVKYKQEELDEIKRVIAYADIDVKKLSAQTITNAIMRSFVLNGNDGAICPQNQRYISEASLEYLKDKLGLPIDKERFERPLTDLMGHTQQLVWVMNQSADGNSFDFDEAIEHEDIELDCLKLIHRFLEVGINPPFDQITNAIFYMVRQMNYSSDTYKVEAANCLRIIFVRGADEHRRMVIDAGVIESFDGLLDSTNVHVVMVALLALVEIVTQGTNDDIKSIASVGALSKLIGLLYSDHHDCVETSLQVLVLLEANGHITQSLHALLLPHVIRLIKRKTPDQSDVSSNCSILLRKICEIDQPPIQTILDLEAVPMLIEIMRTAENGTLQTNLKHVMINLLSGTKKQRMALVEEVGFLSALVYLVDSKDVEIAEKAILAAGSVANISPKYCDSLLQAGIILPLLRVLKQASSVNILKVSTSSFAKCCRGKLDFATSKASLMVLTQLLVNDDKKVAMNSCWALFYILDGLTCEGVNEVLTIGFVDHLLKQLPNTPHNVQEPILKSLYLITMAGDACIKAITLRNGIACLSKALSSSHVSNLELAQRAISNIIGVDRERIQVAIDDEALTTNLPWLSSSYESNQELACRAISNIISGDKESIQIAIDNNVVPCLAQMLTAENNKKHALWTIYQITKAGNAAQVINLVQADLVIHLCDLLTNDCGTTIMALWTLKNILRVGKENTSELLSSGAQKIENKLEELINENLRLENDMERVDLLRKKKAWIEFDDQKQHLESLKSAPLSEQLNNNSRRLQWIEKKIASAGGAETALGKVYVKLHRKERNAKAFILNRICTLSEVTATCEQLLDKAEKIAPKKEWKERLNCDDLPTNLADTRRELNKFRSSVRLLKATRGSFERRSSIEEMKGGFESLFKCFNDAEATKKKRKATEEPEDKQSRRQWWWAGCESPDEQEGMDIDYDSEETRLG